MKMHSNKKILYKTMHISVLTLFSLFLAAQEDRAELVTDRPDQTESSSVVPKLSLQVESGFVFASDNLENKTISIASTLFRYGLHENAELRFGINYDIFRATQLTGDTTIQGFSPIDLGTKIYIAEENGLFPELALITSLTLPYGSEEFKTKYVAPTILLAASHTLSEQLSIGYNIGAIWNGQTPEALGKYSFALGWGATEKLGVYAEAFGTFNTVSSANAFDAGFTYLLRPNLQLDVSGGVGLNKEADKYYAAIGVSWRIPK